MKTPLVRLGARGREREIGASGFGAVRLGSRKRREAERAAVVDSPEPTVTASDRGVDITKKVG